VMGAIAGAEGVAAAGAADVTAAPSAGTATTAGAAADAGGPDVRIAAGIGCLTEGKNEDRGAAAGAAPGTPGWTTAAAGAFVATGAAGAACTAGATAVGAGADVDAGATTVPGRIRGPRRIRMSSTAPDPPDWAIAGPAPTAPRASTARILDVDLKAKDDFMPLTLPEENNGPTIPRPAAGHLVCPCSRASYGKTYSTPLSGGCHV
ncbi:MAG: hypothetical protein KJ579_10035, partial [Verrucomicrobia bacterium]|nr:hypothetical protein [Verrucomicrobiota bacterium]